MVNKGLFAERGAYHDRIHIRIHSRSEMTDGFALAAIIEARALHPGRTAQGKDISRPAAQLAVGRAHHDRIQVNGHGAAKCVSGLQIQALQLGFQLPFDIVGVGCVLPEDEGGPAVIVIPGAHHGQVARNGDAGAKFGGRQGRGAERRLGCGAENRAVLAVVEEFIGSRRADDVETQADNGHALAEILDAGIAAGYGPACAGVAGAARV